MLKRLASALALLWLASPAAANSAVSVEWRDADAPPAEFSQTLEAPATDDLWQRVRQGFKIPDEANPLIANHENWYASRPDYIARVTDRARRYLHHIVEALEARSMPTELALLPIIESAYNPTALSPSAASGIWQFIPSTGRHYGLKQIDGYDGRRDFPEATRAALDYLGKLYLDFGDWRLALAAYNCGEGCVARAIQKNADAGLPTDYASLALPAETRNYVPKLMAVKNIIADPARFNLVLNPVPNAPYFDVVSVPTGLDFPAAARLANVSQDEFRALNAAYAQGVIRRDTPARVLVPAGRAPEFQRSVANGEWDKWEPYSAAKGEAIAQLARRLDTSVERLERHNQLNLRRGHFVRDQTILVPVRAGSATPAREIAPVIDADASTRVHTVEKGDTFFSIARRYGVSLDTLREANPGVPVHLALGQQLLLPDTMNDAGFQTASLREAAAPSPAPDKSAKTAKSGKSAKAKSRTMRHTIKRGDTLFEIAARYDVSVDQLKSWNRSLTKPRALKPGSKLTIKRD